ncbi:MAG: PKD domain-containing protein [Thermoflexibacter sp.]|nr:PKD domain-containing protein [Thermoflexibacter sp.]
MRVYLICVLLAVSLCSFAQVDIKSPQTETSPLFQFTENKNQWEKEVIFRAEIPNGFLFLKKNGLHYGFYDGEAIGELRHPKKKEEHNSIKARVEDKQQPNESKYNIRGHGVSVTFLNANPQPFINGKGQTGAMRNYFIGEDENKWASNVSSFKEVNYLSIYKGISFRFFTQGERLKYEFVVEAGANPHLIQLQYEGADKIQIRDDGYLEIETSVHTFGEKKPYTYQIINGEKVEIPSQFILKDNHIVGFELGDYNTNLPLVIDPQLVFSTFSGSTANNWGNTATYDSLGNLYTAGTVFGVNFPTTVGAFQRFFGGLIDVGITKYNPTGTRQLYATFIGGTSSEVPHSLVVNGLNQLVVMGTTSSVNFPTSFGAFDRTYNGGDGRNSFEAIGGIPYNNGSDIFVSTLTESGNALLASTYLGGSGNDGLNIFGSTFVHNYGDELRGEVNVDNLNNVYIASTTRSTNFPLQTATQTNLLGLQDAVFIKISQGLNNLLWSTYWGGSGLDVGYSVKINKKNEILVCGSTTSNNIRTSATAFRPTYQGGTSDGFVVRYTTNGTFLDGSYLGTSEYDQALFLDLDTEDNVYILGNTRGQYPISQGVYNNPNSGQFIQKLNPTLSTSFWSTVIGARRGSPDLSLTAFLVNQCGNLYVAGWGGNLQQGYPANSSSVGLPVTADAIRTTTDGLDFHLMLLEKDAKSLLYGTFFGGVGGEGDHIDGGTCRFDKKGVVYHAACVCRSNRFFTTPGVWSRVNNAAPTASDTEGCNNAAFKIDIEILRAGLRPLDASTGAERRRGCAPLRIRFQNQSANAQEIEWNIGNGLLVTQTSEPIYTFTQPGRYVVRQRVSSRLTCATLFAYDTITVFAVTNPTVNRDTIICRGGALQLRATGGTIYRWSPAEGLDNPNIATPVARPNQTTRYTVTVANAEGCSRDTSILITIVNPLASFNFTLDNLCDNSPTVRLNNTSPTASEYIWDLGDGRAFLGRTPPPFKYTRTGNYRISLTAKTGNCTNIATQDLSIVVQADLPPITLTRDTIICRGQSLQLNATGGNSYLWQPATGLSNPNIPNPIAQPIQTTRYTVTIINRDNCRRDTSVIVSVANPIANFSVRTEDICAPSPTIRLTNTSTDATNFVWDFGNGQTFTGQNPPPIRYQQSGNYQISLTAQRGACSNRFSQMISVSIIPDITPSVNRDTTLCNNETLQLIATGGISYRWSPATGLSNPNIANPIASPTQTTRYTVSITRREGCVQELSTLVNVANLTTVSFAVNYEDFCAPFPTVRLVNTSPARANFFWDLGNGQTFTGQEPPPFKYSQNGNYRISLIAREGRCTNQFVQNVAIEEFIFPNVITPNGDGKNETLIFNSPILGVKIEIYNRWGKLVYQSDNYQNDWKGEGIAGVYYYMVTSSDGKSCKGWLNVFTSN